jgi:hypothetical protein
LPASVGQLMVKWLALEMRTRDGDQHSFSIASYRGR